MVSAVVDDSELSLAGMLELIRTRCGVDLTGYKAAPLWWVIQRRMQLRRIAHATDYEVLLASDPTELHTLVRAIPIHVTAFFRDPEIWRILEDQVIPDLAGGPPIRAWTPACSTGEEAYSLAMLLVERNAEFQLFATDASTDVVARARRGIFKPASVGALPPARQAHFHMVDDGYRANRALRDRLAFAPHNLLADPPFAGLDIVSCRNLLIYLERESSQRVLHLLHSALRVGGYLVLGRSESALDQEGFVEVVPHSRIYCKTHDVRSRRFAFPRRSTRAAPIQPITASVDPAELSRAELESSREQLQALNEELRASNVELDAANDELAAANTQLRDALHELEARNTILSSDGVLALFLDCELRVRFFTPEMTALFPILATDLGRQITDFAPRFTCPGFVDHIGAVLRDGATVETDLTTFDGRCIIARFRRYRLGTEGVAITFRDVTELRALQRRAP